MELCSYAAQRPDAYQERIAIVVDGFGRQVEESERLLIGHAGLNPTLSTATKRFPNMSGGRWPTAESSVTRPFGFRRHSASYWLAGVPRVSIKAL